LEAVVEDLEKGLILREMLAALILAVAVAEVGRVMALVAQAAQGLLLLRRFTNELR
jgi:hypothetical protein